jgi:hypothetical protein
MRQTRQIEVRLSHTDMRSMRSQETATGLDLWAIDLAGIPAQACTIGEWSLSGTGSVTG